MEKAFHFIIINARTQVKHFSKSKFSCCPRESIKCLKKHFAQEAIEISKKNRAKKDKSKVTQKRKVSRND